MKFWGIRLLSILAGVSGCFLLGALGQTRSDFVQTLLIYAGLYVTLSVSLNLINGITGQFSIGHAAFYQIGAYTTGFLADHYFAAAHLPPILWLGLVMVAGAIAASIAGFVVGLPSLRLKGDYLAIVTLGFGEIIRIVVQNQEALGGSYGMKVEPKFQYIWLVWLLAVFCIAVCRNLLKTAHGLPFLAVREDEVASSAMGVNVTRVKVLAFIIGSAFAGAAGALLAHFTGYVNPDMFRMDLSFMIVTMVVLGGTGSITGSVIAAILLFYLPEYMRSLNDVSMGMLVAIAIGIVASVATARWIRDNYHGLAWRKASWFLAVAVALVLFSKIAGTLLTHIPVLATMVEGSKLRMVVFAVTLISLMLLRPDGIFGHHELSWTWVGNVLRWIWRTISPKRRVSA